MVGDLRGGGARGDGGGRGYDDDGTLIFSLPAGEGDVDAAGVMVGDLRGGGGRGDGGRGESGVLAPSMR